jgi:hypothetical protein
MAATFGGRDLAESARDSAQKCKNGVRQAALTWKNAGSITPAFGKEANAMIRWITILLFLALLAAPGCALMEDLGFGPDPYEPHYAASHGNSCGAPLVVNTNQTQEPELLTGLR